MTYRDADGEVVATQLVADPEVPARHEARAPRQEAAVPTAPSRGHPGQRVLVRGRAGAPAPHPALHRVRRAAPPARPACARLPVLRVGHGRGRGRRDGLPAYVVDHYPQVPAFDYPLVIALVELEEGTRLVANLVGVEPDDIAIGMPVQRRLGRLRRRPVPARLPPGRGRGGLMDFTFARSSRAVPDLARPIFGGLRRPPSGSAEVEQGGRVRPATCGARWPRPTCSASPCPRPHGGAGLGLARALPAARGAGPARRPGAAVADARGGRWRSRVRRPRRSDADLAARRRRRGRSLTAALDGAPTAPSPPARTTATQGPRRRLAARPAPRPSVPAAHGLADVLVPAAASGRGPVPRRRRGVRRGSATRDHRPRSGPAHLALDGAPAGAVGDAGDGAPRRRSCARSASAWPPLQVGVAEAALRLSGRRTPRERQQFGRPLVDASRASRSGGRRLHRHRGDAGHAVAGRVAARRRATPPTERASLVAKWWASEGGQRVVHVAQHLHGGHGRRHRLPVHRYFLWGKQIERRSAAPRAPAGPARRAWWPRGRVRP